VLDGALGKTSIVDAQALAPLHEPMVPHLPQSAITFASTRFARPTDYVRRQLPGAAIDY